MRIRRQRGLLTTVAVAGSAALALTACSPGAGNDDETDGGDDGDEVTTVTFRLWDESAVDAYKQSFDAFTAEHPDIEVEIEQVPWDSYWERLPQDISSETMSDIFWTNTSNFGIFADQGNLINVTDALGSDHDEWNPSVVDLYTRDDSLWGVPQLSDSIALFYNKELLDEADVDPTSLRWDPSGDGDTLIPALQELTTDSAGLHPGDDGFDETDADMVWGFNSQNDMQAIYLDFLAQNGTAFQDGDEYDFDNPQGVEAFQYLVDLINTEHVAPPAADTNANGDLARDLFVQGRMALFQSGQYSLAPIASGAEFQWGIAPIVEGPQGRIGVSHGVAALGNAATEHEEETVEVLRWLGSAEGQEPLGATGSAFPAALDAQQTFTDYWTGQGVETEAFLEAANGETTPGPLGPRSNAGLNAINEIFPEMFAGQVPVADALQQAQEAGNEAIAE